VTLQRILAVLSAAFLVGAVALATLGPPSVPLGQVLLMIDHDMTEAVHGFVGVHLAEWLWTDLAMPVLIRPAWLVPVTLGLICAGAAASLSGRKPARRPTRRSQR
jgi:hypothetical protein